MFELFKKWLNVRQVYETKKWIKGTQKDTYTVTKTKIEYVQGVKYIYKKKAEIS